jgi:putative oxidoreductase
VTAEAIPPPHEESHPMWEPVYALARILLPILFIVEGVGQLANIDSIARMLQETMLPIPGLDVIGPARFMILGYLIGLIEIVGGLMIVVGFYTRTAALVLAVFTICTIVFGHPFWLMDGQLRALNLTQALKNLSIIAGLLMVAAVGAGAFSLDNRRRDRPSPPLSVHDP